MAPPKLMATKPLPGAGKGACPDGATSLTYVKSGGAFLDGCYMNTTRSSERDEATGEEAQNYLYMWKHACAFTKWVPSNQFMYSNLDYDAETMTLERFGFIGMDKRCFWGAIGVLWKRPLPVLQILPNATILTNNTKPEPPKPEPPKPKPGPEPPKPPVIPDKPVIVKRKKGVYEIQSRINPGNDIQYTGSNKYMFKKRVENALNQHWWITGITDEIYIIQSELSNTHWFETWEVNGVKQFGLHRKKSAVAQDFGSPEFKSMWLRLIPIKNEGYKDVYALESMQFPGWYVKDPGENNVGGWKLVQSENILTLSKDNEWGYFNIPWYHD